MSTGCCAGRGARTLGDAGRGFFERDDEADTVAVNGAGVLVESEEGTGSGMISGETGSVWAAVETLGEATVAVGTTMGLEEVEEESVETAVGTDTGTGGTTGDGARTGAGAGQTAAHVERWAAEVVKRGQYHQLRTEQSGWVHLYWVVDYPEGIRYWSPRWDK